MPGPFDGLLGAVIGNLSDRISPVLDHSIRPWISNLTRDAMKSWTPVLLAGLRCGVPVSPTEGAPRCGGPAVASCICCGKTTCLHHALVAQTAAIVCIGCVTEYMALLRKNGGSAVQDAPWVESRFEGGAPRNPRQPPPPPSSQEDEEKIRDKHLRTLGLDEDADEDDVKAAYREMVKTWHPDRASDEQKSRYNKKFLKIQAAYEYLSKPR